MVVDHWMAVGRVRVIASAAGPFFRVEERFGERVVLDFQCSHLDFKLVSIVSIRRIA